MKMFFFFWLSSSGIALALAGVAGLIGDATLAKGVALGAAVAAPLWFAMLEAWREIISRATTLSAW